MIARDPKPVLLAILINWVHCSRESARKDGQWDTARYECNCDRFTDSVHKWFFDAIVLTSWNMLAFNLVIIFAMVFCLSHFLPLHFLLRSFTLAFRVYLDVKSSEKRDNHSVAELLKHRLKSVHETTLESVAGFALCICRLSYFNLPWLAVFFSFSFLHLSRMYDGCAALHGNWNVKN